MSAFESSAQIAQEEALMLEMETKRLREENMRLRGQVRTPYGYGYDEEVAGRLFDSTSNTSANLTLSARDSPSFGSVHVCICIYILLVYCMSVV